MIPQTVIPRTTAQRFSTTGRLPAPLRSDLTCRRHTFCGLGQGAWVAKGAPTASSVTGWNVRRNR
ncbi:MAG: hypothetical protein ACYC0N_03080 [Carboxydocellales bacterium]